MADEEKTEDPTGRQLSKAKEEGNVAKSKELPAALTLVAVTFFFFFFYGSYLMTEMARLTREILSMTNYKMDAQSIHELMVFCVKEAAVMLTPYFVLVLVISIAANIIQVGFLLTPKALQMKLDRIDPIKGAGKFFSKKSLVELLKSLFKIFAISYLAYLVVKGKLDTFIALADMDFYDILEFFALVLFEIMWKIALMVLIMAILDFMYQKWQYKQDLKMTKHQVKEERKQMEGDPQVKSRIRRIQRDMARQRMMQDVPQSDVVVTNPTHYAVALRYSPGQDRAPIVLAKGQRLVALRIRELAKEHGVLIHEDPPIARSLFKTVDIGEEIPENLYKAVAEILALVDKFKRPA